jgi:hypothetical protein
VSPAASRRFDVVGPDGLEQEVAQVIGQVRKASQTLEQAQRILPLFAGILKNASHAGRLPAEFKFGPLLGAGDAAGHRHVLQVCIRHPKPQRPSAIRSPSTQARRKP